MDLPEIYGCMLVVRGLRKPKIVQLLFASSDHERGSKYVMSRIGQSHAHKRFA